MSVGSPDVFAFLIAVCFAAGLNLSGTMALLGLLARAGIFDLPGGLGPLADWWVIGACSAWFVVETVADKVPWVDVLWNVVQTFVRVPAAGLLAYAALPELSPGWQLAAGALGSLLALVAHSLKTALRTTASASPEPASNIMLSVIEDLLALGVTWFATQHPWLAAGLVAVLVVSAWLVVRWLWRRMASLVRRV